jgi:hypothetical protein
LERTRGLCGKKGERRVVESEEMVDRSEGLVDWIGALGMSGWEDWKSEDGEAAADCVVVAVWSFERRGRR